MCSNSCRYYLKDASHLNVMFVGDFSTTCSMMSLMESILTTELTKSFKQLAGREYSWVQRLDGF